MNKIILEEKPVSQNKEDDFLTYVLCFLPDNRITKYCVWLKREEEPGNFSFHSGQYTNDLEDALKKYKERK